MATTQIPASPEEPPPQRTRSKREQVLVACKLCRGRKTKCSGERPRCQQCQTRGLNCEWEVLNEDAPRAAKRKYQDLEQRSANEHELLNFLRTLPEADCLKVITRLREGCSTDDILIHARELSSDSTAGRRMLMSIRPQPTGTDQARPLGQDLPHVGPDSERQSATGIQPVPRPTLPPLASIWQPSEKSPSITPFTTRKTELTKSSTAPEYKGQKAPEPRKSRASSVSLYDRFMNQG